MEVDCLYPPGAVIASQLAHSVHSVHSVHIPSSFYAHSAIAVNHSRHMFLVPVRFATCVSMLTALDSKVCSCRLGRVWSGEEERTLPF